MALSPALPCFLDLNAATEFFQHIFPSVMIDNKHTVLLIWPFISFKHSHWWSWTLVSEKKHRFAWLYSPTQQFI